MLGLNFEEYDYQKFFETFKITDNKIKFDTF